MSGLISKRFSYAAPRHGIRFKERDIRPQGAGAANVRRIKISERAGAVGVIF